MRSSPSDIRPAWNRPVSLGRTLGLAAACLAAGGCRETGPARYRIHGTVTHAGVPVPLGRIVFDPDVTRDNDGPQGFAPIEDGRFDTASRHCHGTVGGPVIVRIDGFEKVPAGEDATTPGRRLFPTYESRVDLPRESREMNFDIPAAAR